MTEELLERLIEVVNDLRSPTLTDWLLAAVPGLALVVTWLLWWRDRRTLLGEIETGRQREARAVQPTLLESCSPYQGDKFVHAHVSRGSRELVLRRVGRWPIEDEFVERHIKS